MYSSEGKWKCKRHHVVCTNSVMNVQHFMCSTKIAHHKCTQRKDLTPYMSPDTNKECMYLWISGHRQDTCILYIPHGMKQKQCLNSLVSDKEIHNIILNDDSLLLNSDETILRAASFRWSKWRELLVIGSIFPCELIFIFIFCLFLLWSFRTKQKCKKQ